MRYQKQNKNLKFFTLKKKKPKQLKICNHKDYKIFGEYFTSITGRQKKRSVPDVRETCWATWSLQSLEKVVTSLSLSFLACKMELMHVLLSQESRKNQ